MNILYFVLATIGLTSLLVESQILYPVRWLYGWIMSYTPKMIQDWLGGLFNCHQCCGFWAGLGCGSFLLGGGVGMALIFGFIGSFLGSLSAILFELMIYKRDYIMSITPVQMPPEDMNG